LQQFKTFNLSKIRAFLEFEASHLKKYFVNIKILRFQLNEKEKKNVAKLKKLNIKLFTRVIFHYEF